MDYNRNYDSLEEERAPKKQFKPQPRPGHPINVHPRSPQWAQGRRHPADTAAPAGAAGRPGTSKAADTQYKVVYHKQNDLGEATQKWWEESKEPTWNRNDTSVGDDSLDPCTMMEYNYNNWANSFFPSTDDNLVRGMAQALALIIQVAANGPESVDHEKAFLGIQFLSTIRNDVGETPPNILAFMEYIDFYTRNDDTDKVDDIIQPVQY